VRENRHTQTQHTQIRSSQMTPRSIPTCSNWSGRRQHRHCACFTKRVGPEVGQHCGITWSRDNVSAAALRDNRSRPALSNGWRRKVLLALLLVDGGSPESLFCASGWTRLRAVVAQSTRLLCLVSRTPHKCLYLRERLRAPLPHCCWLIDYLRGVQGLGRSPPLNWPKNHGRFGAPYCAARPKSSTVACWITSPKANAQFAPRPTCV
jgi:hypothetical protein